MIVCVFLKILIFHSSGLSNTNTGVLEYDLAKFISNPNQTHINQVFRITTNFKASVLVEVGAKLCRTLALQEQDWTILY